jgi:4-amino-4-deoxy-L-arabinose transferase-like glycosyltransferase
MYPQTTNQLAATRAARPRSAPLEVVREAPRRRWRGLDFLLSVAVLGLAAAILLPDLGATALSNWDEALYGTLTREFLARPSWTIHYGGAPYFEKPPLGIWMMALASWIFGESERSLRLPSALCGIALVWLTFASARKLGGRAAGIFAVLLLLGVPHFVAWSRVAMLDVPMVAFGFSSVVLLLYAGERRSRIVAAGTVFGLAILVKWVEVLLFLPGIVALIVARQRRAEGAIAGVLSDGSAFALVALFVALPWHLEQLVVHGRVFFDTYVVWDVFERLAEPLENHGGDLLYYPVLYDHNAGRLGMVHALGLALAGGVAWRRRDQRLGAMTLLAGTTFAVISLMRTKIGWYLTPVYPGAAVAAGAAFARLLPDRWMRAAALVAVAFLASSTVGEARTDFVQEYGVMEHATEVRELAATNLFRVRVPLLYVHVVAEPAPHYYLADHVAEVDDAKLDQLIGSGAPFLCLTYPQYAEEIVQAHPQVRILLENDGIAAIARPAHDEATAPSSTPPGDG